MTAVGWLLEVLNNIRPDEFCSIEKIKGLCEQAKEMEEQIEDQKIRDAIMYALDWDGHTGEWKIKFANNYINNLKQTK
jgi:hypothetical protein